MTKNCGSADRVARIVIGIGLAILVYFRAVEGTAAIVAGVIAAYLLITGLLAMCVVYKLVGVDTSVQEQPYSTTDDRAGL